MATFTVSGYTEEQVEERRQKYDKRTEENNLDRDDFEDAFCLAKIPKQPDDYDGPQRYCMSDNTMENGRCKHHGGAVSDNGNENLGPLNNMKHGMYATKEHLIEDFDEKDEALYDWIMNTYRKAYDISFDNDPNAMYDLHRYAVEAVRAERGRGYLIEEGEIDEKPVRNEEGAIVTDERGDIVTEKSEHYLAQMLHRQDKKLTQLAKELGITRKEQKRYETASDAVETMKSFSEVGQTLLSRSEGDFDPDSEQPWEEE